MSESFIESNRVAEYLKAMGITEPLKKRIETIYGYYREICPDKILDIFISEYITEDGLREFQDLRFFSKTCLMLAPNFVTENDLRISPMKKRIGWMMFETRDYDFKNATEKSRLTLTGWYGERPGGEFVLKGSKENCDYLMKVFHKHIVPNFMAEP